MKKTICTCDRCGRQIYCDDKTMAESKKLPKIFSGIIHHGLYGGNEVIPLKSLDGFDRTTEGSAVYLNENSIYEDNYLCVQESPKSVMTVMEMAEMALEK